MPHLEVTLCDGQPARIELPTGNISSDQLLRDFLEQRGIFEDAWIKLGDGEYVRYDEISRVKLVT